MQASGFYWRQKDWNEIIYCNILKSAFKQEQDRNGSYLDKSNKALKHQNWVAYRAVGFKRK